VVTTKDAYLLQHINVIDAKIPSPDEDGLAILRTPRGSTRDQWERDLLERFSSGDERHHDQDVAGANTSSCLSYWDITNLIDLEPGDA
jgi:hypothetical protein